MTNKPSIRPSTARTSHIPEPPKNPKKPPLNAGQSATVKGGHYV